MATARTASPRSGRTLGAISGDGSSVAFVASGVLDTDNVNGAAGSRDAYVRSLDDDTTHMVSVTTADTREAAASVRHSRRRSTTPARGWRS